VDQAAAADAVLFHFPRPGLRGLALRDLDVLPGHGKRRDSDAASARAAERARHRRRQSRHVPTSAWFTGTGLGDLFRELGDLALATVGYSILGMALGQFVRSAVFAVIIGFAWLVAVENIITRIVPSTEQWLPGASITAVASGGAEGVDYAHGMILGAIYVVVAIAAAMAVFLRKDVTA
jgi:hypothetical protein